MVKTYLEKPDGTVYRSRLDGDIVPAGSVCVVTDGDEVIKFPYESTADNYGRMQMHVNRLCRKKRHECLSN